MTNSVLILLVIDIAKYDVAKLTFAISCIKKQVTHSFDIQVKIFLINDSNASDDLEQQIISSIRQKTPHRIVSSGVAPFDYFISSSKADYVLIVDVEQYIQPTLLEWIEEKIETHPKLSISCVGYGRLVTEVREFNVYNLSPHEGLQCMYMNEPQLLFKSRDTTEMKQFYCCNAYVRTDIQQNSIPYPTLNIEDQDFVEHCVDFKQLALWCYHSVLVFYVHDLLKHSIQDPNVDKLEKLLRCHHLSLSRSILVAMLNKFRRGPKYELIQQILCDRYPSKVTLARNVKHPLFYLCDSAQKVEKKQPEAEEKKVDMDVAFYSKSDELAQLFKIFEDRCNACMDQVDAEWIFVEPSVDLVASNFPPNAKICIIMTRSFRDCEYINVNINIQRIVCYTDWHKEHWVPKHLWDKVRIIPLALTQIPQIKNQQKQDENLLFVRSDHVNEILHIVEHLHKHNPQIHAIVIDPTKHVDSSVDWIEVDQVSETLEDEMNQYTRCVYWICPCNADITVILLHMLANNIIIYTPGTLAETIVGPFGYSANSEDEIHEIMQKKVPPRSGIREHVIENYKITEKIENEWYSLIKI